MMPANPFITLVLLLTCAAATGCSRSVSMSAWQDGLDRFVANQQFNDSSFLRDPNAQANPPRFAMLGGKSPDDSTDISGAFLGRRNINGTDWLIFIVARIEKREVEDIRIAMASDEPEDPGNAASRRWLVSDENPNALQTYLRYKESQWRRLHPNRTEAPIQPTLFPYEGDVFRLSPDGNMLTVVEEKSGARWTFMPSQRNH